MSEIQRGESNCLMSSLTLRRLGVASVAAGLSLTGCSKEPTYKIDDAPKVTCLEFKDGATFRTTPRVPTAEEGGRDANKIISLDLGDDPKEVFVSVSDAKQSKDNNGRWIRVSALEASTAFPNPDDLTGIAPGGKAWVAVNTGLTRVVKKENCKKHARNFVG